MRVFVVDFFRYRYVLRRCTRTRTILLRRRPGSPGYNNDDDDYDDGDDDED